MQHSHIAAHEDGGEEKSFGRTRKLLDPAQLERRRKQAVEHKRDIEAQIAEKRRIRQLEDEIQTLNTLKIENESKQMSAATLTNELHKRIQQHYQNLEQELQQAEVHFVSNVN